MDTMMSLTLTKLIVAPNGFSAEPLRSIGVVEPVPRLTSVWYQSCAWRLLLPSARVKPAGGKLSWPRLIWSTGWPAP
jgi:hypothetical protein